MKKAFLMGFLFLMLSSSGGFTQDNIYGDYLIGSLDKKVSLDLEGAQLVDVLKMLSQQIGLNFISTGAVGERSLTLYMEEVPLREAMDVIFEANNLAYDYYPDSNIFVVKGMGKPTLELKTKVYYLKYARVTTSKVERQVENMLEDEDDEAEAEGGGLKGAVEAVLTEFGKVTEDPATNSLIVVDVPVQFPVIDELISKLDIAPIKVMIEVEILDVDANTVDKLGFKYTNTINSYGLYGKISPFPATFFPNKGPSPFRTAIVDLTGNELIAEFYEQDTTTKVLARPKILTLNNETAEINVTTNEVINTKGEFSEGVRTSTTAVRISDIGDLKGSGVTLKVTPQVNSETREVTLVIEPSVVSTTNSSFVDLEGNIFKNVEDRSTRSIVRLRNNETLFLGGLIRRDDVETVTKVPFLGNIPLIGSLFRHKDTTGTGDRELVIFLTPHILEEGESQIEKAEVLFREQQNSSKESSMKVVLDRCDR